MMAARGYTTLREVFLYAVERANRIVNKLGKVTMLWNADLEPGKLPVDFERNMVSTITVPIIAFAVKRSLHCIPTAT